MAIYWLSIAWLSAGYGTKSIRFKTSYTTMYQSLHGCKQYLDCSVFTRCLATGWLLAGYWLAIGWLWLKINTLQYRVIDYYIPKVHMAASNSLDHTVVTRFSANGWLSASYWLAMVQNQSYPWHITSALLGSINRPAILTPLSVYSEPAYLCNV